MPVGVEKGCLDGLVMPGTLRRRMTRLRRSRAPSGIVIPVVLVTHLDRGCCRARRATHSLVSGQEMADGYRKPPGIPRDCDRRKHEASETESLAGAVGFA